MKKRLLGNKVNFIAPQTIWKAASAARLKARQHLPKTIDPSIDIVRLLDKLNAFNQGLVAVIIDPC